MNKKQYQEYLLSDYWKEFSRQAKSLFNNKCWFCGSSKNLNLHHLRYCKKTFYSDRKVKNNLRWFLVLCNECHANVHSFIKANDLELFRGTKEFKKIYYPAKSFRPSIKRLHQISNSLNEGNRTVARDGQRPTTDRPTCMY